MKHEILFENFKETCKFISTNTNSYGFTNCFYKLNNDFYVSAYNIDDASSNINGMQIFFCDFKLFFNQLLKHQVFKYDFEQKEQKNNFSYEFSLDDSETYCISTLSCSLVNQNANKILIASASNRNFKLWSVDVSANLTKNNESDLNKAKILKMCKHSAFHAESEDEDTDGNNEDDHLSKANEESQAQIEPKGKYCLIQ